MRHGPLSFAAALAVALAASFASAQEPEAKAPEPEPEAKPETPPAVEKPPVEPDYKAKPPPSAGPRATWHPDYLVEVAASFGVAAFDQYDVGLGAGANFTVPVLDHFPFKGIDDDFGFGVGFIGVRYAGYRVGKPPKDVQVLTYALYVPMYAQWNVWLGSRVSFFLEPTLLYRFADYSGNGCADNVCAEKSRVLPTGFAGLRFRIGTHIAGIFKVGWPMATLGASWL